MGEFKLTFRLIVAIAISVFKIATSSSTAPLPRNCADLQKRWDAKTGIETVYLFISCDKRPVLVYCDQTLDGGGWTVIQRRKDLPQREDFFRSWGEYEKGFGNLTGEFWLGLRNIHALTDYSLMELRVDLEDYEGVKVWAKYSYFSISDSADMYRLALGRYVGNAGDSLSNDKGQMFSTKDKDNDAGDRHCAKKFEGAWWYGDCYQSNLNGFQYKGIHEHKAGGIHWFHFKGFKYSLKTTTMSIRPAFQRTLGGHLDDEVEIDPRLVV